MIAPIASAAIQIQFSKTNAYPGDVIRATTATNSVPLSRVEPRSGGRWFLFLVRVDVAAGSPKRGIPGVFRVAPLRVTATGRASATFRVPNAPAGYYTPAIGCRSCPNRTLILGGEHSVTSTRRDILRIVREG